MKKKRIFRNIAPVLLLVPLLLFAACDAEELGSLEDLSMPYCGVYECERLELGGKNLLEDFDFVRLELAYSGDFALTYRTRAGGKGTLGGTYRVDTGKEEISFSCTFGVRSVSRTFPMPKGSILIEENFLGKPFFALFKT